MQGDLIGAPEPMSIEAVLSAPNGGSCAVMQRVSVGDWRGVVQAAWVSSTTTFPDPAFCSTLRVSW